MLCQSAVAQNSQHEGPLKRIRGRQFFDIRREIAINVRHGEQCEADTSRDAYVAFRQARDATRWAFELLVQANLSGSVTTEAELPKGTMGESEG